MTVTNQEMTKKRLERLAWLTDNSIPIPGLNAKIGIDPLIGLLPWLGDVLGILLSGYIIIEAARLGAPKSVLLKMVFNVSMDTVVGALPGVGDVFDFVWKANQRNVRLLERYIEKPRKTMVESRLFIAFIILIMVGIVVVIALAGFWLVRWLWGTAVGHGGW